MVKLGCAHPDLLRNMVDTHRLIKVRFDAISRGADPKRLSGNHREMLQSLALLTPQQSVDRLTFNVFCDVRKQVWCVF